VHPPSAYFTTLADGDGPPQLAVLAEWTFSRVFRRDHAPPGFALISFERAVIGEDLRAQMEKFKEALDKLHQRRAGRRLAPLSFVQFDQQRTTKFHLDGGPRESLLILGYEPSAVESELFIADYSRAAWEMGISPAEYLSAYNPMFASTEAALERHVTALAPFDRSRTNVLVINNSSADFGEGSQGVMHKAIIPRPTPDHGRVVHSMMLSIGDIAADVADSQARS
jgi:hypothetical protein